MGKKTLLLPLMTGGTMHDSIDLLRQHLPSLIETIGDDLYVGSGEMQLDRILPATDLVNWLKTEPNSDEHWAELNKLEWKMGGGTDENAVIGALLECHDGEFENVIYVSRYWMLDRWDKRIERFNFIGVSLDQQFLTFSGSPEEHEQKNHILWKQHILGPAEFAFFVSFLQKTYPELP